MMQNLKPLLIKLKNTTLTISKPSNLILNSHQLQLLYILLLNQQIPSFFKNIISFLSHDNTKSITDFIVVVNFLINIIVLGYLVITFIAVISCPLREILLQKFVIKIFKFKFYLLFVIGNYLNLKIAFQGDDMMMVVAIFNVVFAIVQARVISFSNVSYRFQQKDQFKHKKSRFINTVMILPILYLIQQQNQTMIFAIATIVLRSLHMIYQNMTTSQQDQIQYSQYFYPLVFLSLSWIEIYKKVTENITSGGFFKDDSNVIFIAFLFWLIMKTSQELAATLCLTMPKRVIKQHNYFQKNLDREEESQSGSGQGFLNQQEEENFVLCLRIFIKMYFLRKSSDLIIKENSTPTKKVALSQYDWWWQPFNRLIINHRAYCARTNCHCHQLINRQFLTNKQAQQKIFLNVLFDRLKIAIANKPFNPVKLSIIEKYFYIEILGLPLKSYYELVKLSSSYTLTFQQDVQVTLLKKETHGLFEKLFNKQKVQNQTLNIDQVIELQNKLSQLKSSMHELTLQEQKFYTSFSNTYVEMDVVNKMTKKLKQMKQKMDDTLKTQLDKLSRHADLLSFSLIYYRNFDQYSQTLGKLEQKLSLIGQYGNNSPINYKDDNRFSKNIDVFDPQYGAIKIDLVFRPGQIKTITKNLCNLLGYKKQQIQNHKVNKIMPHIFAKHHDKFLRNFIEKGSINMLKTKQRIFYARNSQKFILPISVRLKVQYMLEKSFSATALIKKTQTHSGFILLNKYGKIEEISQSVYKMLFQKALQGNVSKVKKINMLKMLLALNIFIKNLGDNDQSRVFEGTIITSQSQQAFDSWFKITELGRQKHSKKSQLQLNSGDSTGRSFTSNRSKQFSQNSSSYMSTSQRTSQSQKDTSQNTQKYTTDMREEFREYFRLLDLDKIKALRVSYKFYDLHTVQFSCKVLQITKFWEQLSTDVMKETISREIIEIGELYGMNELDLQRFKQSNVQKQLLASKKSRAKSLGRRQSIYGGSSFKNNDSVLRVSTNKSLYQESSIKSQQMNNLQNMGSVGSSLSTKGDKSQGKNAIITAFNIKQSISPNLQHTLTVLMLLSSITLLIIGIFSTTLTQQYQTLQNDNMIISNFRNNFQFRLAVQQLYHFYHPLNLTAPEFLLTKKHILTDSMKQQLVKSTQWINDKLSDELYLQREIVFVDIDRDFVEKRAILSFLGMIYSMFLMTQEQGQRLSDNYEEISTKLYDLSMMEKDIIFYESDMFVARIHIVIGLYTILLTSLIITLRLIYKKARTKQQQIVQLLTFMNRQRIEQKAEFFQHLGELIKANGQFIDRDVEGLVVELEQRNRQELVRQESVFMRMVAKKREDMKGLSMVQQQQQQEHQIQFDVGNKQSEQERQQNPHHNNQGVRINERKPTSYLLLQKPLQDNNINLKKLTNTIMKQTKSKSSQKANSSSSLLRIITTTQSLITPKNILTSTILFTICILVIISTEYFYTQADDKFMTYIELKQSSLMLQSIPSRLLLLNLINFDKIVHGEQTVIFGEQFMRRDVSEEYQLMVKMAKYDVQKDQLTQKINEHFYQAVCQLITCENVSLILANDSMYDLTYRFENAFNYIDKIYLNLAQSLTPKTDLSTWVEQNNIIEIFKGTQHILELMRINQQEISTIFGQQIYQLGMILLVASLVLMPVMLLLMVVVKRKFLQYVYGMVKDCQSVLGQFDWGILGGNKYAVNYLNGKVKNVKVQQ